MPTSTLDSSSTGDPARHLSGETLKQKLAQLPAAPKDSGTLTLMVSCREEGRREMPGEVTLTPAGGMPVDAWFRNSPHRPESQLAVMQTAVAELIANGQTLPLFGDNLWLDLDLSTPSFPTVRGCRSGSVCWKSHPNRTTAARNSATASAWTR